MCMYREIPYSCSFHLASVMVGFAECSSSSLSHSSSVHSSSDFCSQTS